MSWQDRVKPAAYTPPSGVRLPFLFEDVAITGRKKTSEHNFPDVDGSLIQDHGRKGRRVPLRIFFSGTDYDTEAQAFTDALDEVGVGQLEHPMYGTIIVVPFGEWKRQDKLKTGANQAVIDVTFLETIEAFISSQVDPAGAVTSSVEAYNVAGPEQFAEEVALDTGPQRATFKQVFLAGFGTAREALKGAAATSTEVLRRFNAIADSVTTGIDELLQDPVTLARQTDALLQAITTAPAAVGAKLDLYQNLITTYISVIQATTFTDFKGADLLTTGSAMGQITSTASGTFPTRTEALAAAERILDTFDEVNAWRESNYAFFGVIDTGEGYQAYQETVAATAAFLIDLSFTLKQEKTIITDRARNLLELVAELYGEVDPQLDFFIQSNALTGPEILEIPAGREIKYYV